MAKKRPQMRKMDRRAAELNAGLPLRAREGTGAHPETVIELLSGETAGSDEELVERIKSLREELTGKYIRHSRASYLKALAAVYEVYVRYEARGVKARRTIYRHLALSSRKNANPIAEFLRLLIDYESEEGSRAGARALARDALVLQWAYEQVVPVQELGSRFKQQGLEAIYRQAVKAMKLAKAAFEPESVTSSEVSTAAATDPAAAEPSVDDDVESLVPVAERPQSENLTVITDAKTRHLLERDTQVGDHVLLLAVRTDAGLKLREVYIGDEGAPDITLLVSRLGDLHFDPLLKDR